MIAKLQAALPHDMFVHEGMAMIGDGGAWFDSKGLAVLNLPSGKYQPSLSWRNLAISPPTQAQDYLLG